MVSIDLVQMANSSSSMQQVVKHWDTHIQEIESVIAGISEFSGMEDIIYCLKKEKSEIEDQEQKMIQMFQAADKIRTLYDGNEKNLVNNVDEVTIVGKKIAYSVNKDMFKDGNIWTLPKI